MTWEDVKEKARELKNKAKEAFENTDKDALVKKADEIKGKIEKTYGDIRSKIASEPPSPNV